MNVTASREKDQLDPFGSSSIHDYNRLMQQFGIQPFHPFLDRIPEPLDLMRRGVVFGHRDFEQVLEAMSSRLPFAVMSGIKPTGSFHLGTMMIARQISYYQKLGGEAFYCIADVEAYEDNGQPFQESLVNAVSNVADLLAVGFDTAKGHIYLQSRERHVNDLAVLFARKVSLSIVTAIYGERHLGLYLSALMQAGDMLMPQLPEMGGPRPTLIPVGADQDPHLRLTRDLAAAFQRSHGFLTPSSTYHKLVDSLDGSHKMSKRSPMGHFTLSESPGAVREKILQAFTGGQATAEEQRRTGGNPEICPVYQLGQFLFQESDDELKRLHADCRAGYILCGECKLREASSVERYLSNHQRRKRLFIDRATDIVGALD